MFFLVVNEIGVFFLWVKGKLLCVECIKIMYYFMCVQKFEFYIGVICCD